MSSPERGVLLKRFREETVYSMFHIMYNTCFICFITSSMYSVMLKSREDPIFDYEGRGAYAMFQVVNLLYMKMHGLLFQDKDFLTVC